MTGLLKWSSILLISGNLLENSDRTNPVLELLGIFLIFCCVLYLAYVASRFIGKKFAAAGRSRYINVVERVSLGLDKHLFLVKVGAEHYLFMSGRKDFRLVAKVAVDKEVAEEQGQDDQPNESVFDFREIFDKYVNKNIVKLKKKKKKSDSAAPEEKGETLRENIDRLKKMQDKSYDKEV